MLSAFVVAALALLAEFTVGSPVAAEERWDRPERWTCRNNVIYYEQTPANPGLVIFNIMFNNQVPRNPNQIGYAGVPGGTGVYAPPVSKRDELDTRSESDVTPVEDAVADDPDLSKRQRNQRRRWRCRNNVIYYNQTPANPGIIIFNIIFNNQIPRNPNQIGFPGTPQGTGIYAPDTQQGGGPQ